MSGPKPLVIEDAVILDEDGTLTVRFSKPLQGRIYEAVFEPEALFALAQEIGEEAEIPGEKKNQVVPALAVSFEAVEDLLEDAAIGEEEADAAANEAEAERAALGGAPIEEVEPELQDAEVLDVKPTKPEE